MKKQNWQFSEAVRFVQQLLEKQENKFTVSQAYEVSRWKEGSAWHRMAGQHLAQWQLRDGELERCCIKYFFGLNSWAASYSSSPPLTLEGECSLPWPLAPWLDAPIKHFLEKNIKMAVVLKAVSHWSGSCVLWGWKPPIAILGACLGTPCA